MKGVSWFFTLLIHCENKNIDLLQETNNIIRVIFLLLFTSNLIHKKLLLYVNESSC